MELYWCSLTGHDFVPHIYKKLIIVLVEVSQFCRAVCNFAY